MANIVTGSRIIFSIIMLLCPVFSTSFYTFYLLAGLTDMVDGTIARRLGTESEFGARLDTVADMTFLAAALYKILPVLDVPVFIWVFIGGIALIKGINIVSGFVVQKKFVSVHTVWNKITGFILFVLPFTLSAIKLQYSGTAICLLACFAAISEGHLIRTGKRT